MPDLPEGHAVKVLEIVGNNNYRLNEDALCEILLQDGVRDRPVVVVSVAGGYRRGKSFILDYFLRYLKASIENKNNGRWLGELNEPLRGFSWRGGSDRETTGILLWSEPIHATLDNGEEVVVLLMDTQGTFDSSSTVRDSSTVFAMSTLISSVQIYNLSMNINEDDLQHLHLFTEYGRLAMDSAEDSKAFQVLQFLVRDWSSPYELPYGAEGGRMLLAKRLEITDTQMPELRELREHIHSCFEELACFLMPHPGLNVRNQNFNGSVGEILEEFRESLLELTDSILSAKKLTPKVIAGRRVKGQDLLEYFKTYMSVFNSSELPTPVSILQATAQASMLMAKRDAHELYEVSMERQCGVNQPSVFPDALLALHNEAVRQAVSFFTSRKRLGPQDDADLQDLTEELTSRLQGFVSANNFKIRKAFSDAKDTYDVCMTSVYGENPLCLHPDDLEQYHYQALTNALREFDASRRVTPNVEDEERNALLQYFGQRLSLMVSTNEQNNDAAVATVREDYAKGLDRTNNGLLCVSPPLLLQKHDALFADALHAFKAKRNTNGEHAHDPYEAQLVQSIQAYCQKSISANNNQNKMLIQNAMHAYNNYMASVCPNMVCLHPSELWAEHGLALARAKEEFNNNRVYDDTSAADDEHKKTLESLLSVRYQELCHNNVASNNWAVDTAYSEYCRKMDAKCGASLLSLLIVPLVLKILVLLPKYHLQAKAEALRMFWSRRRTQTEREDDEFLENLKQKLKTGYVSYCDPVIAVAREMGLSLPSHLVATASST